ncbi:hypothetical protein [Pseudoalteromonas luteoviolacea]|uniref:Lipoprotein n=1 Tax=Pseudoalteromonas luteoviolacea NCIMB 1942 TaxID=1365253 RepID=A0A167AJB4_9GAMM|nr:hypothetical protein [Pseudoalteromonas luteoviolacea]KZN45456.1 hypothetical protein N482_14545 [Pseudoalteromonas luteoviolacea NCIMB 1942]KZX02150.1 hypothetical protein JL49_02105 [Pseudoalteromonas luteoviolacea]
MKNLIGLQCITALLFATGCVYSPKKQVYYDETCNLEREVTEVSSDYLYKPEDGQLPAISSNLLIPAVIMVSSSIISAVAYAFNNSIESVEHRKACLDKGINPRTKKPFHPIDKVEQSQCISNDLCAIERTY